MRRANGTVCRQQLVGGLAADLLDRIAAPSLVKAPVHHGLIAQHLGTVVRQGHGRRGHRGQRRHLGSREGLVVDADVVQRAFEVLTVVIHAAEPQGIVSVVGYSAPGGGVTPPRNAVDEQFTVRAVKDHGHVLPAASGGAIAGVNILTAAIVVRHHKTRAGQRVMSSHR